MRAVTWHGRADVRVDTVPDPTIQEPTDVVIEITSSGICGSDLHLIEVMAPFMTVGRRDGSRADGHRPRGRLEVTAVKAGDRVVVPFNISCNTCWMCSQGLQSQCETTQNREQGFGASLFGYTKLYGQVPGGQAEYLRVPFGNTLPIKVPDGPSDDRFVYLSDVLPTAWQAVQYAGVPQARQRAGPRPRTHRRHGHPHRPPPRRRPGLRGRRRPGAPRAGARAGSHGHRLDRRRPTSSPLSATPPTAAARTPSSTPSAWRPTARRSRPSRRRPSAIVPDAIMEKVMQVAGVDRLAALNTAIEAVRRGGTISLSGVYGGATDPMPLMRMFDKQIQLRMGQANVWRWVPDILPLLIDGDPLGVDDFATHRVPLEEAPQAYMNFREKKDGTVKVLIQP